MNNDFFAWVRLILFIALILAFTFWATFTDAQYQMEPPEPKEAEGEQPLYIAPASFYTIIPTEAEEVPELTLTEPQEEITPPTEVATIATEPPTEPIPTETKQTNTQQPRYALTAEERAIVEAVVSAEARGEDFDGQCLVAQCILNTAEAKGIRPDEVVLSKGQYAAPCYEYSYMVSEAISAVFDEGYEVTSEPIRYFYAPQYCTSEWHEESLVFVMEHGGHRFFKER